MRPATRPALATLALLVGAIPAVAQQAGRNPIPAIRADQWEQAQADAAGYADPVAAKLVLFYRLLAPGSATPDEISGFMQANPDWPEQAVLERRRQDALAVDGDDADVLAQCALHQPTETAALLRCADALAATGRHDEAAADARQAWITGLDNVAQETEFLHRWTDAVTPDDQWARFQHLAWYDATAAARQIGRLDAAHRPAAEARLALQRDDPRADALLAGVTSNPTDDPGLMLDHARTLRRSGRDNDAVTLWQQQGEAAQEAARAAMPTRLAAFWNERNLLARQLLTDNDAKDAYAIVIAHGQTAVGPLVDAEFLAGFIALRKLNDPAGALAHFQKLASVSKAAITQGRAWYWSGRAEAAAGHDPRPDYEQAALWPTTFYGQLAALALGDDSAALARRINGMRDPIWNREAVLEFTGHELVRAAAWLVAWGDLHRARGFLVHMDDLLPDAPDRALGAALALRVGLPDAAVFIARQMGRDGSMLPEAGWPMPFDPPAGEIDPAVALGVMRQESSFDVGAVSPSGARGLMQLMPFTATAVARQIGVPVALASLTTDPQHNMRLGTTYVRQMLDSFGGSLPLAIAAYNAGPHRVVQWLATNGDPRTQGVDMIDWMEQIPIAETRNYVQRVLENITIYRARRGETTPTLLAQWTR